MNARKKEIAVLLSLGISKLEIFGQFLIEMVFISIPAYVGSYFLARYTAEKLGNNNETTTPANINEPANNLFEIEKIPDIDCCNAG